MDYPRVLIVGQTFDTNTGPGITNSNLFRGWPYENIAIISSKENENWSVCGLQYLIGHDETAKAWPFSLLQGAGHSRIIRKEKETTPEGQNSTKNNPAVTQPPTTKQILRKFFKGIMNWAGLFLFISKINLSDNIIAFIEEFQPDVVYTQLSTHELICFADEIHEKLKLPVAIHIMDDWPVTVYRTGLLGSYWNKRTHSEFRKLIAKASVLLSISDEMSREYTRRYGREWIAFHNPVDDLFINRKDSETDNPSYNPDRILYLGRIGRANEESILFIISAVIELSRERPGLEFVVYTRDNTDERLVKFSEHPCIKILPEIPHQSVPAALRSAGLLILPLDFSKDSRMFARYSMPSKASEYMSSGVPVLVFAPPENAVTKYAQERDWGYIVDRQDKDLLKKGITELMDNKELRNKIISNATETAFNNHHADSVRKRFREVLYSIRLMKSKSSTT
jgi:glycosyltransferase involved in cell wall biosynthesis